MNTKTTLALLAVLSLACVGCQKETIAEPPLQGVEDNTSAYGMTYSVDGIAGHITLHSPAERDAFIHRMLSLAKEGHKVTFRQDGNTLNALAPKDVKTYDTTNKDSAYKWANEMLLAGYEVSVEFDEDTGIYHCTATKDDK